MYHQKIVPQSKARFACRRCVGNPRKDDESVQTSLRALMEQEEARVRAENERLEQLRAAKIRIDREREEAAREEEERRATEREATKAAAVERARIEALAKAEADRRAEERVVLERAIEPAATPLPPTCSHVGTVVAVGVVIAALASAGTWLFVGAPRVRAESQRASSAWSEAEAARTRAHDAESSLAEERDARRKETDALRDENGRLRRALADVPKCTSTTTTTAPHHATAHARCDPHDPLCADL
jgi:hypothetical protein